MQLHLGPFQGITDVWYRHTFQQYFSGLDKYYTPFFGGIRSLNSKHFRSAELNPRLNEGQELIPQILTNCPLELERFVLQCKQLGYKEVNINMGCPWPQVSSKKRGCGLMPHPKLVAGLISHVKDLPLKISVKCRLGMYDASELEILMPIFEQSGISGLIVHARTGKQLYKGKAQPEVLAATIRGSKLPIVYNGDVFTSGDLIQIAALMPDLSGIMLGRGLLANPFLPADMKGMSAELSNNERAKLIKRFIESLTERRLSVQKHSSTIPGPMKELWWYMSRSFENPVQVWRIIRKTRNLEEYLSAQANIFEQFDWLGTGFGSKTESDQIDI